jgi:hypothetical protein
MCQECLTLLKSSMLGCANVDQGVDGRIWKITFSIKWNQDSLEWNIKQVEILRMARARLFKFEFEFC